jgi:hypothetical protein
MSYEKMFNDFLIENGKWNIYFPVYLFHDLYCVYVIVLEVTIDITTMQDHRHLLHLEP